MKMVQSIKKIYRELPVNLKRFLIRGAILFVAWSLLYNLLLKPAEIPDSQLSHVIVVCTAKVMSWFYNDTSVRNGSHIFIGAKEAIQIAPACNGLELLVLYVGFLLCIPTSKKRFWGFALGGVTVITILNVIRCVGLAILFYNDHPMADFAHHYLFKLAIYAVIFYIWVLYSKKYMQNA